MRAFKDEEEAPAPAVPMPNSGPKSGDYVTVVTTPKPCGKRARLDGEGQIQFESRGDMVAGTARTVHVPDPESLLALLSDLSDHQYVVPDFVPETVGLDSFTLLTQGEHKRHYPDADLAPVEQAGRVYVCLNPDDWYFGNWRILDRDVDADTPDPYRVGYAEWLEQVDHLLPGVLNAPRVYWPSSKARVQKADGCSVESLNGHTWIKCEAEGVDHTDAMRGRLRLRADALGMAWFVPRMSRKTGEPLPGKGVPKTILDPAVWTIHRVIFAGAPAVGEGLHLLPSQGFAVEGVPIDLHTALPEPTEAALERYRERTGAQVEVSEKGTITITDRGTLTLDDEVLIKDHDKPMTLRDFWSDPAFAFGKKYRCQTIVRESSSWNGILRKFAGGTIMHYDNGSGIDYLLDVKAKKEEEFVPGDCWAKKPRQNELDDITRDGMFDLSRFTLRGCAKKMERQMLDEVFVLEPIALLGQCTVIYAKPNAGKTLLTLHLLREAARAGQLDLDKVFYINADDTHRGLVEKAALGDASGFHTLAPGYGPEGGDVFRPTEFTRYLGALVSQDTARGVVVVLDTLKKFTDLMDKKVAAKFMRAAREFVSRGGSLILLAHTNKNRSADGSLVAGGTSDVPDDADCVYTLDSTDVGHGVFKSVFTNVKARGDVAASAAFEFVKVPGEGYVALLNSVRRLASVAEAKAATETAKRLERDKVIIDAITRALSNGPIQRTELLATVVGVAPRRRLADVLDTYAGSDFAAGARWRVTILDRGAKRYESIEEPGLSALKEKLGQSAKPSVG